MGALNSNQNDCTVQPVCQIIRMDGSRWRRSEDVIKKRGIKEAEELKEECDLM